MGKEKKPFLALIAQLIRRGVDVRLIHAKEPGLNFREDFDKYPVLYDRLERVLSLSTLFTDSQIILCKSDSLSLIICFILLSDY